MIKFENKELINIGFTVNNLYCCHLATTMASILYNANTGDNFHFYVLNAGDITDENKKKLESLKKIKDFVLDYVFVKNSDFIEYVTGCHISTNYRLKIGSLIPQLDKILFLDVDVIVCGSLADLYAEDITDYYAAAVINPCIKAELDYVGEDSYLLPGKPFNTGVILLNLKLWRENNLESKIFDIITWYSKRHQRVPDQNTINIVMKDKIKVLHQKYNACPILAFVQQEPWNYDEPQMLLEAFEMPVILHYASQRIYKVWNDPSLPYADYYWKYLKMTPFYEQILTECVKKNIEKLVENIKQL